MPIVHRHYNERSNQTNEYQHFDVNHNLTNLNAFDDLIQGFSTWGSQPPRGHDGSSRGSRVTMQYFIFWHYNISI